ncbi:hypothetical protein [Actinoallomurus sp. CA-142502]|uniref:hypothetical protein n=1 Tax=Actinoallomurus sp. CA-142502 TaxID=3239885 RepID=UPI003D929BC2
MNVYYDEPVAPPPPGEVKPRRRMRVTLIIIGALVVLAAATWAAGGLRAQPGGPAQSVAGRTVNQGLFDVQILDARSGRMKLSSFDPAANLLVVRMRVTDLGDQSYGVSSFISGVAAEPKPGKYVEPDLMDSVGVVDGQVTSEIHPRLPVVVQLVWKLGDATAPRALTVALRLWEYGQSFTTDEFYWSVSKQSPVKAEVKVPVRLGATS